MDDLVGVLNWRMDVAWDVKLVAPAVFAESELALVVIASTIAIKRFLIILPGYLARNQHQFISKTLCIHLNLTRK